jgi:large subunit ribosomal protein L29
MKIKELRELSKDELVARRGELKKQSLDSRVQMAGGQLENSSIFRNLRKEVAHIETILSERRLNVKHRAATAVADKPKKEAAPEKAAKPAAKKATAKKAAKSAE